MLLHVLDITVFKKWCFFTLSKPPWVQGFGVRPGFSFVTDPVSAANDFLLLLFFFQGTTLEMTL